MTLGNYNGTDGQTDRQTDRQSATQYAAPPREEGHIINEKADKLYLPDNLPDEASLGGGD